MSQRRQQQQPAGAGPKRVFVKICGLTTSEAVRAAVEAGADALGFVFAESPRRVAPEQAADLGRLVPTGILRVAVMHHPRPESWREVAERFKPDWLQTEAEDFAALELPAGVQRLPVFRDLPDLDETALRNAPRVLFEAAHSGTGQAPDWGRAARLAPHTAFVLAGGLTPETVGEAIRRVCPWGVDVSSGVEKSRGVKDPARIHAFVAAVRRAERESDRANL